eukprot:860800-Amphidinium_carterae.1
MCVCVRARVSAVLEDGAVSEPEHAFAGSRSVGGAGCWLKWKLRWLRLLQGDVSVAAVAAPCTSARTQYEPKVRTPRNTPKNRTPQKIGDSNCSTSALFGE